ncbi:MAG: lipoyl synthase [Rikenellaceae bacterium]|nr:lipoyl synthase [Rikenellaceae bacterium]
MPDLKNKVVRELKPEWLKIKLHDGAGYAEVAHIVERHGLHTICSSGRCPNKAECWSRKTATFMILGDICTRGCKFCATPTGRPLPVDKDEPQKVAESIRLMGLRHAVITSVDRDDLPDAGADHWRRVIEAIKVVNPNTTVEVLLPDFDGRPELMDVVIGAKPHILGHNLETIRRITPLVRSKAKYDTSLKTLAYFAQSGIPTKSGLMVGLGESHEEVLEAMSDLRKAGVEIVTLGQYLRPTAKHYPVDRYVTPEEFDQFKAEGLAMGFKYVASAPLVRSSYLADQAVEVCAK